MKPIRSSRLTRLKITIWVDKDVAVKVKEEAKQRNVTQQAVIESTLFDRYSQESEVARDELLMRRLSRIDNSIKKVEKQQELSAEAFALFMRMWLTSTNEVPEADRERAVQNGKVRYDRYLDRLAKRAVDMNE